MLKQEPCKVVEVWFNGTHTIFRRPMKRLITSQDSVELYLGNNGFILARKEGFPDEFIYPSIISKVIRLPTSPTKGDRKIGIVNISNIFSKLTNAGIPERD